MITVEEVADRASRRRFLELPWALHAADPRWPPPLVRFERRRLDHRLNPYFAEHEVLRFLARRLGKVVGRIAAHGDGRFGFFDVADDDEAAGALVDAARSWSAERGHASLSGPVSFTDEHEAGVLVEGFDVPGTTGRPWHPPWYGRALGAAGLRIGERRPSYRLAAGGTPSVPPDDGPAPDHAGAYADARLVLRGEAGAIAAVPDVAAYLRHERPWQLARRARRRDWRTAVVVSVDCDPTVLVPALCAAAGRAGYTDVLAPWAPDDRPPETVHALFTGPT